MWHDVEPVNGRPFVADDVVATFQRIKELPSENGWMFEPVMSVEAPDEHTVVFQLSQRYGPMLQYLAHPFTVILPREAQRGEYDLSETIIGTGPFMLESWDRDQEWIRVRNPHYFIEGRP